MTLRTKVIGVTVILVGLSGALTIGFSKWAIQSVILRQVEQASLANAKELAERAAKNFETKTETEFLTLLQDAQDHMDAENAMVLDTKGTVIAHTNVSEKSRTYDDPLSREMIRIESPFSRTILGEWPLLEVSAPISKARDAGANEDFFFGGGHAPEQIRVGTVRLAIPLANSIKTRNLILQQLTAIIVMVGLLAILIAGYFAKSVLRPIRMLEQGTARIAQGNYGLCIPVLSHDELGSLTKCFNHMTEVLGQTTVSKNFLGGVLDSMSDPLFVVNAEGTLRMLNGAALTLLGYGQEEIQNKPVNMIFAAAPEASLPTIGGETSVQNVEMELVTKNGEKVPVLYSSSPLKEEGCVTGSILIAKDMTERKRIETLIRRSEKMSAIGQLAAGVAHEINNPLGVILGFSQALVRRLQPGSDMEMPLKSIEKEAVRCKNLVQDLLTFSRVSKVEREPMDLNRAVESAVSLITAQAKMTRIDVKMDLSPQLPRFLGNPNQIQQVIINLSSNALDAMGDKGTLTVKTTGFSDGALCWVCLKISDTGPGIPKEIQPRIFEPFFTTKPVGKGTGLGLSLVHEIIKKHSGMIEVESRPGHTEFLIKFPVRDPAHEKVGAPA